MYLYKSFLHGFVPFSEIEKSGNLSNNNNDLGYIYLNVFNNENITEALPIANTSLASNVFILFRFGQKNVVWGK